MRCTVGCSCKCMTDFNPIRIFEASLVSPGAPQIFALSIASSLRASGDSCNRLTIESSGRLRSSPGAKRSAQFAASRWLLGYAARNVYGADAVLRVTENPGRGPILTVESPSASPTTSLSHSDSTVICGIARSGALGVDVERVRARSDWEGIAAYALHPRERSRINRLPDAQRWDHFFKIWTLKEAMGKALGVGLALPFNQIEVSSDGEIADAPRDCGLRAEGWRLAVLNLGVGLAGAAAWRADR